MPATMRILGWKAEGLRCPDHDIDFTDGTNKTNPVTLVQMPNGTGKTTTLNLLRAALSGSRRTIDTGTNGIEEFQKKDSASSAGFFEVRLLLNDRRATIRLEFDFESAEVSWRTNTGGGLHRDFKPPPDFRRFMNTDFVNFFIFDGELAQNLLNRELTDAETVVENLFQINSFLRLRDKVRMRWEQRAKDAGAKDDRGLSRRKNRLTSLKRRLAKLTKEREYCRGEKQKIEAELTDRMNAYQSKIDEHSQLAADLHEHEERAKALASTSRDAALEALESMRDPHALSGVFARNLWDLKSGLDRVRLPESAAREFFEELADEDECVCGRPIDDEMRDAIRKRSTQYLASDDVALLNATKSAIQDAVGVSLDAATLALETKMATLSESVREATRARNDVENLQLRASEADPAVARVQEEITKLRESLKAIDSRLQRYESPDATMADVETYGINVIENRIDVQERKVAEITDTIDQRDKRDVLVAILEDAHRRAREAITRDICDNANSRISELMPDNTIEIERIEKCLILAGQEGGSVGETLSVAWAFLATLFNRSEHALPFVVDSPAGSIDLAIRPKIGELIPKLTGQFIAFTISSERDQFVTPLQQASSEKIQFVTLFRKAGAAMSKTARETELCAETVDGMLVGGEDFFNAFQISSEEPD